MKNIYFLFVCICVLSGCLPQESTISGVVETQIGEQKFRIPKEYLYKSNPKPVERMVAILVMYPDFEPPKEKPSELFDKGEWYKNITFNFQSSEGIRPIPEAIKGQIEFDNLTEVVGDYHGLTYRTYPEGSEVKRSELWIEGNDESLIRCGLEGHRSDGVPLLPQCTYLTRWKQQSVSISIDKRLLPHWKKVKNNVFRLLEEFEIEGQEKS